LEIATKQSTTNPEYTVPAELYNNVAVLRHILGKHQKSEQAYQSAIAATGFDIKEYRSQNVTTTYNLARLKEEMCQFDEAEELYKGILKEHPNYVDCNG
jgi:RNA polymerase-associated protein CTR9